MLQWLTLELMGKYATTTSGITGSSRISELLPGYLVGNTSASDTVGVNIFSQHLERTEGVVDSYISARYDVGALTTTAIPMLLRVVSEDIASWMAIRGTVLQNGPIGSERKQAFERAWDELKALNKGDLKLVLTNGTEVATRTSRWLTSTDYTPVFDLDTASSWGVDPDQADDIADARR